MYIYTDNDIIYLMNSNNVTFNKIILIYNSLPVIVVQFYIFEKFIIL